MQASFTQDFGPFANDHLFDDWQTDRQRPQVFDLFQELKRVSGLRRRCIPNKMV